MRFCGWTYLRKVKKIDPGILIKGAFSEDVRYHLFSRATPHFHTGVFLDALEQLI